MIKKLTIKENINNFKDIDLKNFDRKFDEEYAFLYDAKGEVAGEREACDYFWHLCDTDENFLEFVRKYVQTIRQYDPISSDREASAFIFALEDLGVDF